MLVDWAMASRSEPPGLAAAAPAPPSAETRAFVRREIVLAVLLPLALFVAVGLAGVLFRAEVTAFAGWVHQRLGFAGLATLFLVSETIVSPLPPDAVLFVVAASEHAASWLRPVLALALLSLLGGHLAWLLGSRFAGTAIVRLVLGQHHGRIVEVTRRYGIWAIVLAALTPLPWSVTSIVAGALHLPWRRYLAGSVVRLPRIVLGYVLIHAAFHRAMPMLTS
jgi:membrane protein YqaA with SNARE-associated domain